MEQHSIRIRPAKPTIEEGLIYAYFLDEAFEGLFRIMLGKNSANIVAVAYTQPNHDFSYKNAIFAEYNKNIVGMAAGYTREQRRSHTYQPIKHAVGKNIIDILRVKLLCLRLGFLGTNIDGDYYLQAIATRKEFRGKGVGSKLLDAVEERARISGSTRLILDASAKNDGARKLYERHGMKVELSRRTFSFLPRFIIQMTKRL